MKGILSAKIKLIICMFSILLGFLFLVFYFLFWEKKLTNLGLASIIVLGIALVILIAGKKYRFLSFPVIFTILIWVFHFGFFPLYLFGAEKNILFNDLLFYSNTEIVSAYNVAIIYFFTLVLGLCVGSRKKLKLEKVEFSFKPGFIKIICILFVICAIPYLYYSLRSINLGGYMAVRANIMSGILSYTSLVLYACAIMLFKYALDNNQRFIILFFYIFFTVQIFSGQRFDAMCMELTLLLMHISEKKIKVRTVVVTSIVAVFGLYILTIIGVYRLHFDVMFEELFQIENFEAFLKNNPVYQLLADYGGTFTTLLGAVRNYSFSNYLFGGTYLVAGAHIVPLASRFFPSKYVTFINGFHSTDLHSLGGSVFGEAYSNFGVFGCVPIFILGMVLSQLYSCEKNKENKNILLYCWYFIIYLQMFNVVRGYIKNVVFLTFWGYIVIKYISLRKKR